MLFGLEYVGSDMIADLDYNIRIEHSRCTVRVEEHRALRLDLD